VYARLHGGSSDMSSAAASYPPIFDGHNDTVLALATTGRSFFERSSIGHIDLPRAREGRLGGGFFAVYIGDPVNATASLETAMELYRDEHSWPEPMPLDYAQSHAVMLLGRLLELERASGGEIRIIHSAAALERCLADGALAMLLHFEGAEPLDPEGRALETFYAAGLRSVGLTHSRRNRFAWGVPFKFPSSPDTGPGLTDAGKALVRQLNERRVMIDLSHLNEKGFWDVASLSTSPLVATHSNVHALTPASRNLTDAQIDAIRDSGGMIGLNFAVSFLRRDGMRSADTPISRMVDHLTYLIERAGIDHVGLGSDFDGALIPAEIGDAAGLPALVRAIQARGYTGEDLTKLLHGNWVRVLRDTWGA
jgi:membrane dipeptidase